TSSSFGWRSSADRFPGAAAFAWGATSRIKLLRSRSLGGGFVASPAWSSRGSRRSGSAVTTERRRGSAAGGQPSRRPQPPRHHRKRQRPRSEPAPDQQPVQPPADNTTAIRRGRRRPLTEDRQG